MIVGGIFNIIYGSFFVGAFLLVVGLLFLNLPFGKSKKQEDEGKMVGWSEEYSSKPKPKPKRDSKGRFIKQQDEEEKGDDD